VAEAKVDTVVGGVTPVAPAPRARAFVRPVLADGWHERWVGWASFPVNPAVLATAAVALVGDAGTAWAGVAELHLGRIPVSPATPLALLLVVLLGASAVGLTRTGLRAWREFLVGGGAFALVAAFACAATPLGWRGVGGVAIAAVGEEVVYRIGTVLLVGALCARLARRDWRDTAQWGTGPALGGVVGAAVVFSALPGHVGQVAGVTSLLPFASLAALLGYAALRTGALLPCVLVHLLVDLVALTYLAGSLPPTARLVSATIVLGALVAALLRAGLRLGLRRRVPTVIDLRTADLS
jgi:Type II CAAX prenyl endopeptidase Rce1-like